MAEPGLEAESTTKSTESTTAKSTAAESSTTESTGTVTELVVAKVLINVLVELRSGFQRMLAWAVGSCHKGAVVSVWISQICQNLSDKLPTMVIELGISVVHCSFH